MRLFSRIVLKIPAAGAAAYPPITTQGAIVLPVVRQFEHQCFHWAVSRRNAAGCEDVANYPPTNVFLVLKLTFYTKIFTV